MRMKIIGRNSCMGKSRHIDIRYFFIKYWVEKGELRIMYCPTHLMLADDFTKALQRALFHQFQDIIMGGLGPYTLIEDIFSYWSKERVGKQISLKYIPSKREVHWKIKSYWRKTIKREIYAWRRKMKTDSFLLWCGLYLGIHRQTY